MVDGHSLAGCLPILCRTHYFFYSLLEAHCIDCPVYIARRDSPLVVHLAFQVHLLAWRLFLPCQHPFGRLCWQIHSAHLGLAALPCVGSYRAVLRLAPVTVVGHSASNQLRLA